MHAALKTKPSYRRQPASRSRAALVCPTAGQLFASDKAQEKVNAPTRESFLSFSARPAKLGQPGPRSDTGGGSQISIISLLLRHSNLCNRRSGGKKGTCSNAAGAAAGASKVCGSLISNITQCHVLERPRISTVQCSTCKGAMMKDLITYVLWIDALASMDE
jgi:hypothetical protein